MEAHSHRALLVCLALLPAWLGAQTVKELPSSRTYVAAGVYQEGGQLHFERPEGPVVETLGAWQVMGSPVGELIGLSRPGAEGGEIRIVDRGGRQVGTGKVPRGRVGIVTDKGIITLPEALHAPVRRHELGFLSLQGVLLREVSDADLLILSWSPQANGRMVTINNTPAADRRTVIVYGPEGKVIWRFSWQGGDIPSATVTPDDRRLVLLRHDGSARTTDLVVLGAGNRVLRTHHLPSLYQAICSADSRRIAAVGRETVVLVDAETGALLWRKDEDIDFVAYGGLRFDAAADQLLIVAAKRDQSAKVSRLSLRSFRLVDGDVQRADLGKGSIEQAPTVLDIGEGPAGERHVMLHDRVVQVPAEAWSGR